MLEAIGYRLECQANLTSRVYLGRVKRIWYISPMRAAKVQASLRIRAVSPEPPLLAHTSSESRGTFRQKARSLAPLNIWAGAVKICHDGMLEDTNSLGVALVMFRKARYMHVASQGIAMSIAEPDQKRNYTASINYLYPIQNHFMTYNAKY